MSYNFAAATRVSYSDLQCEPIFIESYESSWAREYQQEYESLVSVVDTQVCQIEHVGSTSVPGLSAKPTIDIGIAFDNASNYRSLTFGLESLGYQHYPEYRDWLPDIGLFIKRDQEGQRSHHALVVKADAQVWVDYLDFRDCLRSQPHVAGEYAQLKRAAAVRHRHDRLGYNVEKTAFIEQSLQAYRQSDSSSPQPVADTTRTSKQPANSIRSEARSEVRSEAH